MLINEGNLKYVEDNQISNFGCPMTTNFLTKFCYPVFPPPPPD